MSTNSVIVINHDYLDWIGKYPTKFVNAIVGRMLAEQPDPYPGHARWNGDASLGVQVAHIGDSDCSVIMLIEQNSGKKLASMFLGNDPSHTRQVKLLKKLADNLGYSIVKTSNQNNKSSKPAEEFTKSKRGRKPGKAR